MVPPRLSGNDRMMMKEEDDYVCVHSCDLDVAFRPVDFGETHRGRKRRGEGDLDGGICRSRHSGRRHHRDEGDGQGELDQSQLSRSTRLLTQRRRIANEEGSVVEAAIAIPAAML